MNIPAFLVCVCSCVELAGCGRCGAGHGLQNYLSLQGRSQQSGVCPWPGALPRTCGLSDGLLERCLCVLFCSNSAFYFSLMEIRVALATGLRCHSCCCPQGSGDLGLRPSQSPGGLSFWTTAWRWLSGRTGAAGSSSSSWSGCWISSDWSSYSSWVWGWGHEPLVVLEMLIFKCVPRYSCGGWGSVQF